MMALTFDTLKFTNRLKAAGVPAAQAEAEAEALSEVMETHTQDFALRSDIELLRRDMNASESRFNNRLEQMEMRLTIKLGTFMGIAVGIMTALNRMH